VPTPPPPACTSTFGGDPTGATDVGASLASFLKSHTGLVCLAPGATYLATQVLAIGVHDLVLDGRGATIQGTDAVVTGIFRLRGAQNVTVRNLTVLGTSHVLTTSTQYGAAFYVDGGAGITLDHVSVRNVRGDGIYVGYNLGTSPATDVRIIAPDLTLLGRNGIAPVAGQVSIQGGRVSHAGMFGVDFECNKDPGCASIIGSVVGTDFRALGEQWSGAIHYAVAAGGLTTTTKQSISVIGISADQAFLTIRNTAHVSVQNVVSDSSATAKFPGCGTVVFSSNHGLVRAT
jgi:hypothetical protein